MDTTVEPATPGEQTSLLPAASEADIIIKCGGETFSAYRATVRLQSQKLQDACDAAGKDATVFIQDDTFDAPTMRRMLDFMNHGEYDVGLGQDSDDGEEDATQKKLDVLCHLFCYAIAESYQVEELAKYALIGFTDCLRVVSPKDFADLMGVIAAHTGAKPVHNALRKIAIERQDELAECKWVAKVLNCKHILERPDRDPDVASDLRAAKQLAAHGVILFRVANKMKSVKDVEIGRLVRAYQEALRKIAQLRSQVDGDSSTRVLDEQAHNEANLALQASEARAKKAKDELMNAEERASRTSQANQKMKLELEVLRNAEYNNKLALEKAHKEAANLRLALEEREKEPDAEVATLRVALEASMESDRTRAANERRMSALLQKAIAQQTTTSEELVSTSAKLAVAVQQRARAENEWKGTARGTTSVKNEFLAKQRSLIKVKQDLARVTVSLAKVTHERDQAVAAQKATAQMSEKANQDSVGRLDGMEAHSKALDKVKQERDEAVEEQMATARKLEEATQEFASHFNEIVVENTALARKIKEEREKAVEEQNASARRLETAHQESVGLRSRVTKLVAETTALQNQVQTDHTAMSEGAKMLKLAKKQKEAMVQQAAEASGLKAEVNLARLTNFTLQRSINDLQLLILNNAESKQQLLQCHQAGSPPQ